MTATLRSVSLVSDLRDEGATPRRGSLALLDVAVGAAATASATTLRTGGRVGHVLTRAAAPIAPVTAVIRIPLATLPVQPSGWIEELRERGHRLRLFAGLRLSALLDVLVPAVVDEVLRRLDIGALIVRYVDLDDIVAGVDLDAAVSTVDIDAIVGRVDVDAIIDRVDVDAVAASLDVEAVVRRLDLTRIVTERVDLDRIVAGVDLQAIVDRIDVDSIVGQLDLNQIVAERVDIDRIIERIDLAGLAEEVIAEIDLPEIIRESTGSVASDTVRGVRMQAISGDESVGRIVERLRLVRRRREPPPSTEGDNKEGSTPNSTQDSTGDSTEDRREGEPSGSDVPVVEDLPQQRSPGAPSRPS